jgi:Archaebacterial flagellin
MENILFALFSAVLLIISTVIMATASLRGASTISQAFNTMQQQSLAIRDTSIDLQFIDYAAGSLRLAIYNTGQADLSHFDQWDMLVQKEDGSTLEMAFEQGAQAGANQWVLQGIYITDARTEVFNPGILNPDEHAVVALNMVPGLDAGDTARVTVATPNGVTAQCMVTIDG